MIRLDARAGAAAAVLAGTIYLAASLATGHSARAEVPPDLSARADEAALDVWKAAAALVQEERAAVVDVRPAEAYARFHVPGAVSAPGASAAELARLARERSPLILCAGDDEAARKLAAQARQLGAAARVHYLTGGARAWYLALQLPVPLFAEAPPPAGYADALREVSAWFAAPRSGERGRAVTALQRLARLDYRPTLLQAGKKAAPSGGRKKISGGCG